MTTDIHSDVAVIVETPIATGGSTANGTKPDGKEPDPPTVSDRLTEAAKWVTVGFAAVTAGLTVAGASTSQLSEMSKAFPRQVTWLFLVALLGLVVAAAAWVLPKEAAKNRLSGGLLAAVSIVVVWAAWAGLWVDGRVPTVLFPISLTVIVGLVVWLGYKQFTNVAGVMLVALLLLVSSVAGAVQIGANALGFITGMSASATVTVEGQWATVSTVVKATGLPTRGGVRLFLVDPSGTSVATAYVAADVAGAVDATVPLRVPAKDAAVDVRLSPCTTGHVPADDITTTPAPPPKETIICSAKDGSTATTYAQVAIAGDVPAASLAASVAPSADGKAMVLTVSGSGLTDVVQISYGNGPGNAVTATVRPDGNGAAEWKATVALPRGAVTLTATSGSTSAKATYKP